jgi:hypothetical protein
MHAVRAATTGGLHDDVSVSRSFGDFGIPVFHRPGWKCQAKAASLTCGSEVSGIRGDRTEFKLRRKGLGHDIKRQEK